jgi:phosphomannomutase
MKLVREGAKPISVVAGLKEIKEMAINNIFDVVEKKGTVEEKNIRSDYIDRLMQFIDLEEIKPMKVVVNPNFGAAGENIDLIANKLKLELVKLNFEENGNFPKGRPDPLIPSNREETMALVKKTKADFGVAWDVMLIVVFFSTRMANLFLAIIPSLF